MKDERLDREGCNFIMFLLIIIVLFASVRKDQNYQAGEGEKGGIWLRGNRCRGKNGGNGKRGRVSIKGIGQETTGKGRKGTTDEGEK